MPTIQHRDRQQIEYRQTDADQRQELEILRRAGFGGLSGIVGDRNRAADVALGDFTNQHLADDPEAEDRLVPGLGARL